MKKILKVAEKFRLKLSSSNFDPTYVKDTINNLFIEISDQLEHVDIYEGPSEQEIDKIKSYFSFLKTNILIALADMDYSYIYSLLKEVYRLVTKYEAAFSDSEAIYTLIGMKSDGNQVVSTNGGIMTAVHGLENQKLT